MKGTLSGGTAASMKATFVAAARDLSLVSLLRNPFALTPGFEGPKQPPGNKPMFDQELDSWTAPFVMATINTRHVHRSNVLMGVPRRIRARDRRRRSARPVITTCCSSPSRPTASRCGLS
jgi:short subunit dehydrogenase-like uncharacterized protein